MLRSTRCKSARIAQICGGRAGAGTHYRDGRWWNVNDGPHPVGDAAHARDATAPDARWRRGARYGCDEPAMCQNGSGGRTYDCPSASLVRARRGSSVVRPSPRVSFAVAPATPNRPSSPDLRRLRLVGRGPCARGTVWPPFPLGTPRSAARQTSSLRFPRLAPGVPARVWCGACVSGPPEARSAWRSITCR